MHLSTALRHDKAPGRYHFTAEGFYAESLRLRIATVARAAARFLVCHADTPRVSSRDSDDFELSIVLPVTLRFPVVFTAAHFEYAQLLAASMPDDFRRNRRATDEWCAH